MLQGDFRTHANLAEYYGKLGDGGKAAAEIEKIPVAARGPYFDRIVLAYECSGDRRRALETLRSMPADSPSANALKNDPDLAGLFHEVGAH